MRYLIILMLLFSNVAYGQTTYYIRADSTRLQKVGGNNELILENGTRSMTGAYLKNGGNGRTVFYYAVDSASVSGSNLTLWRGGGAQNIVIGLPGGSGVNIYNSDGTLTGNRTLTGNGNTLLFNTLNGYSKHNFISNNTTDVTLQSNWSGGGDTGYARIYVNQDGDATMYALHTKAAALYQEAYFKMWPNKSVLYLNRPNTDNANLIGGLEVYRKTLGTAGDGIGVSFDFYTETATGADQLSNQLISKWTTAANATRTSQFDIAGVNSASTETFANFQTGGIVRVNNLADTLATKAYARSVGGGGGSTPYTTPEAYGALGDGSTNDATAIQNAVNSGLPVWFGQKNYRVSTTILVPDNAQLIGSGGASIISMTANDTILNIVGSNIQIKGLTLKGSSTGGAQTGISIIGNVGLTLYRTSIQISDCAFSNLGFAGIYSTLVVGQYHDGGFYISNSYASGCGVGFYNDVRSEYNTYSNCVAYNCTTGWINNGGNNNWTGGQIIECTTGVLIGTDGVNDGHCQMVGAKINHCTTNISTLNTAYGYLFSSCTIAAGNVSVVTSSDIKFLGCEFDIVSTVTVTNSTSTQFVDCRFWNGTPTFTITGTNPVFRNNYFASGTPAVANLTGGTNLVFAGATNTQSTSANLTWNNTSERLGVSQSNPQYTLDVNGHSAISRAANSSGSAQSYLFDESATGYLGFIKRGSAAVGSMSLPNGSGEIGNNVGSLGIMNFSNNAYIAFGTTVGGTLAERMRIDSAGRVGIGITPVKQFHTTGTVRLAGIAASANAADSMVVVNASNGDIGYRAIPTGGGGGSSPGGSDTYVQFNDGGSFGGDAGMSYNKTTDALSLGESGVNGRYKLNSSTGAQAEIQITSAGTLAFSASASGIGERFLFNNTQVDYDFQVSGVNEADLFHIKTSNDRIGVGTGSPTARLHIAMAGTTSAGTAPLKLPSGTNMTTPEAGAMEWNGTNLFITQTSGPTRKTIAYTSDFANYFGAGTYTPTLGNNANLDASTPHVCQYSWIIDPTSGLQVVTVSGYVEVDPTTTLTDTQLLISVPITSAFGNIQECGGTANSPTIAAQSAGIKAQASGGNVIMQWKTTDTTNQPMYFSFTYKVTPP